MWNKIKKKLFLIILKTHVSESGINGFVPGRMIIAFEEFKNGIDVIFPRHNEDTAVDLPSVLRFLQRDWRFNQRWSWMWYRLYELG